LGGEGPGVTGLLPVEEAVRRIVAGVTPLEAETVPLSHARGWVLAEPLAARRMQPPFPASAMDGYAVRAADIAALPARLTVIGTSGAGHGFPGKVGAGEAVRIFTGAPVPEGADAVLIQEDAEVLDAQIIAPRERVAAGRNIRAAGLDFHQGAVLLTPGRRLGTREIALAAAMGHADVRVRRRPRIAIIATGDELVPPGTDPGPDQIFASNPYGIAALVEDAGGEPHDFGIVGDDKAAIGKAVERARALSADILVTLGGASVGDADLVREALGDRGMALDFWRIAMRPGKPLMFGRLPKSNGGTAMRVLGLPGNPVSSFVCALLFLNPLIAGMLGEAFADPSEPAVIGVDLPANDPRQDYLRAALVARPGAPPVATPFPLQDSSTLAILAAADCLLIRPPLAPAAKAGEPCRIIRLG
jgi:molybdopterin molybdotransferase